jgi:hippurate hydrolase
MINIFFMRILLLLLGLFPITSSGSDHNSEGLAVKLAKELVPLYQKLHQNPELSYKEEKTAATFAAELKNAGFEVTTSFGGTGVVGLLKNGKGPTVMLRTDLDALPVTEATGLSFASTEKQKTPGGAEVGVMHACGHDLHITNMVGVANYLFQSKTLWSGTLVIIGQPAEEKGGGAKAMLEAGLFKKFPKPDYALALHVDSSQSVGNITLNTGPVTANVDSIDITMIGRGGHGARPQDTIDPIPMASELVLALQTLISREKDPSAPAVLTIGSFHSGTKHNIISDSAELQLTLRTFSKETREKLIEGIKRKANAIAVSYGAPAPRIKGSEEPVPSVINDGKTVEKIRPALQRIIGASHIMTSEPWTVGEDFSRFGKEGVPSVMFTLGTLSEGRLKQYKSKGTVPTIHSANYFPSAEESLQVGIPAMGESVIELMKNSVAQPKK